MENNNITAETQDKFFYNKEVADQFASEISFSALTQVLDDASYNLSIAAMDIQEELDGDVRNQIWYLRQLRNLFGKMKD